MKTLELIEALKAMIEKDGDREIYLYNPKTREYSAIETTSIVSHNMLDKKQSFFSLEP